jgi:hypothetical protein
MKERLTAGSEDVVELEPDNLLHHDPTLSEGVKRHRR